MSQKEGHRPLVATLSAAICMSLEDAQMDALACQSPSIDPVAQAALAERNALES